MGSFGDNVGVGGDGSVHWNVKVRDPREANNVTRCEDKDIRCHQTGIAETPLTNESEYFLISIKLPKTAEQREKFLKDALAAIQTPHEGRVRFMLPIEKGNMNKITGEVDQIYVYWPSRRGYKAAHAPARLLAASRRQLAKSTRARSAKGKRKQLTRKARRR
jgi:hypothetical protein